MSKDFRLQSEPSTRPRIFVSTNLFGSSTGWQLPDSTIPQTTSSEPCPPSTNGSTTNRATVTNSLCQVLTCSGLTCVQLRVSPPSWRIIHHFY
ncbi:hypothetical protein ATANTOWER_031565 [Ataeniobius toweri]|uniref:Uncharacterized protein n=1 Tax=Ataeniobius toweri TaxID=208326 RepID=A0ABU7C4K3_9TELE|nr:hypothetical protein [Ataeniobius toweri]